MPAVWPALAARLVALTPTLPGWGAVDVYDGPPVSDGYGAPQAWFTVGYVAEDDDSGSYAREESPVSGMVEESGAVRCELVAFSGDAVTADVRTQAFALADALGASIRSDQTLGGALPSGTALALDVSVRTAQTDAGVTFSLVLSVSYQATSV